MGNVVIVAKPKPTAQREGRVGKQQHAVCDWPVGALRRVGEKADVVDGCRAVKVEADIENSYLVDIYHRIRLREPMKMTRIEIS